MSLIHAKEIVLLTPAIQTHLDELCNLIDAQEYFLLECFGDNFRTDFLSHVVDHTADVSYKGVYDDSVTYAEDDIVQHEGQFYTATTGTNDEPGCTEAWEIKKKFDEDCYNDLWYSGSLRAYLAWGIFYHAIPFVHIDLTNMGFQVPNEDTLNGYDANRYWVGLYTNKVGETRDVQLRMVRNWMANNPDCTFETENTDCADCIDEKQTYVAWQT